MIHVFDTSSFIVIGHYFPQSFPSFWQEFNKYVVSGKIISVREVFNELEGRVTRPHLQEWLKSHKDIFVTPSPAETEFVSEIFQVPHFQQMIGEKERLQGKPVADPFVIASAKILGGFVVSEETRKPNAAKIPNVCDHFKIKCGNIEDFMKKEKWKF